MPVPPGAEAKGPSAFPWKPAAATAPVEKITARNITYRYGATVALCDVTMPLYRNCVTAIIGPSGCGKSTLLRVFNRIFEVMPGQTVEGEVIMDGRNILARGVDPITVRAKVGMVFQKPTPFPMSIFDNVALGMRLNEELKPAALRARVEEALRRAALWEEVKDILPRSGLSLSGGQQQRLCLARTIAVRPDVILLDEPCSALDPLSTAKIEETIDSLKDDHTIAIVTHNLQQAARVSDYTAFMYLGRIVEFGQTEQVFMHPRDDRTQQYVTGRFG
ncbi:phosphate ABC transporter ATP-binding protein PstB [Aquabacter spiritensis]|uniref:phosphate ABC transporter ATP-binding protein PstB n=1 Tax=Aquabacter spiritensis TaxID=933073 RepID=UPI00104F6FAA